MIWLRAGGSATKQKSPPDFEIFRFQVRFQDFKWDFNWKLALHVEIMSASRDHFRKYPVKFVSFKDFRFQDIKDFSNDLRDFKLVADPSLRATCSVGEECPWELESDLCCLRGEKSCGTCSRHHILCEELVFSHTYKDSKTVLKEILFSSRDSFQPRTVKTFVYMLRKNLCEKVATYFPQIFA